MRARAIFLLIAVAAPAMAFAAPRTEGIWDDVREEIRVALAAQGPVEEAQGSFGKELLARAHVPGLPHEA